MNRLTRLLIAITGIFLSGTSVAQPNVQTILPETGSKDIAPTAFIRLDFNESIDPSTLTSAGIKILQDGVDVPATLNSDLSNSAISITPNEVLEENSLYVIEVTSSLIGISGEPAAPYYSFFTTGVSEPEPQIGFRFNQSLIDGETACTSLDVGPDGNLYVSFVDGRIKRYVLDPTSGAVTSTEVLVDIQRQIITLVLDPDATAANIELWVSYATCTGATDNFTGTISKVSVPSVGDPSEVEVIPYITGLPHTNFCEHQPNGIQFSPEGVLYQSVGGVATFGAANWGADESLLSAALIYMDVKNDPAFAPENLPVNVSVIAPVNYDPYADNAPVKIFATGFRNMLGVVFHSNGNIYGATNQNSTNQFSEPCGDVPAINAKPREMLFNIKEGNYYGHQNLSRGECVHNGGNPTSGVDPFEITEYPVGTQPEVNFDPSLIYDIRTGGGNSANGMDEFEGPGSLNGRLLVAYFTGAKVIQAFEFDENGAVIDERPLLNANNQPIRFTGALDVVYHPQTNRIYVADFGVQSTFQGGSVYALDPITTEPPVLSEGVLQAEDNTARSGVAEGIRFQDFTGTGYIDFGGQGSYIEWSNVDGGAGGAKRMDIRYANGSGADRPLDILVNDVVIETLDFPPVEVGNWAQWSTIGVELDLEPLANTIRLRASSSAGGPNVDFIAINSLGSSANTAPLVSMVAPASGSTFDLGEEISLISAASDLDGDVAQVEFLIDGTIVATVTELPYEATISIDDAGVKELSVRATDDEGASTSSEVVSIEILDMDVPVSGVTLFPETLDITSGFTFTFLATVVPSNASNVTVSWSSSNLEAGTIDQNGLFTAVASGVQLEETLSVNLPSLSLSITESAQLEAAGQYVETVSETAETTVEVITADGGFAANSLVSVHYSTDQASPIDDFIWHSNNEQIVTVENGQVTAVGCGEATITVAAPACDLVQLIPVTVRGCGAAVTGVEVAPSAITIATGDQSQLVATVLPADAEDPSLIWVSSNDNIATVSLSGLVTGVVSAEQLEPFISISEQNLELQVDDTYLLEASGSLVESSIATSDATITAITNDGSFMSSSVVTVEYEEDENVAVTEFLWSSNEPSIVSVVDGELLALDCGTAIIEVSDPSGALRTQVSVTVDGCFLPVSDVIFVSSSQILNIGDQLQLDYLVLPVDATNPAVTWSSSDESVLSITSEGLLTAIDPGTSTITVLSVENPGISAANEFIVIPPDATYQAEDYTSRNGGGVETRFSDYTGAGYVDYGGNGTYIEWNNVFGYGIEMVLTFRYANGSNGDRTCDLELNGNVVGSLDFPTVTPGNWSEWGTISTVLTLPEDFNTLRIRANSGRGGPNLDKMDVAFNAGVKSNTTEIVTAIDPSEVSEITIYPNPLSKGQELVIEMPYSADLRLVNAAGQVVRSFSLMTGVHRLSMADLESGLYFARIATSTTLSTVKILVK